GQNKKAQSNSSLGDFLADVVAPTLKILAQIQPVRARSAFDAYRSGSHTTHERGNPTVFRLIDGMKERPP
ncbi:MAG: hypothetical protein ACPHHQ_06660, partial [Pseudomonadales bacterium]